ncbi:MAG: pyridoxamine 5'-phosphate oxidase family protein [Pseudomonadales bacterium]
MLFPNCEVRACPNETTLRTFLEGHREPMRLAVLDRHGTPQIATLWFRYEAGALWGVSHAEAWLTRRLQRAPKVGFEISTGLAPYRGLRGQGTVALFPEAGGAQLDHLLARYGIGEGSRLARWLQGRRDQEWALRLAPSKATFWDYAPRMTEPRAHG